MNRFSILRRNPTFLLSIGFLLVSIIFYLFFTEKIIEFRTVLSVPKEVYDDSAKHLEFFGNETKDGSYFFSPNFESLADTLKDKSIRRFEMREFYSGSMDKNVARSEYYQLANMKIPTIVSEEKFGERKPIGISIAISIIGISLILLFKSTKIFLSTKVNKEQSEK